MILLAAATWMEIVCSPKLQVATAVCSKRKIRRKRGRNTKPVEARSLKSVLLIDVAKTNSKTDLN